jgi:hypothetical protein
MLVAIIGVSLAIVIFICWIAWELRNAPTISDKPRAKKDNIEYEESNDDDFLSFMLITAICCSD